MQKRVAYNYVVSAARESVINHSVSGAFTSEDNVDVICDKGTRVEVRTLREDDRLDLVASIPVFGRVDALRLFRPMQDQPKDWLFVLTNRKQAFILAFEGGKLVEKAHCDLSERVSRKHDTPLVAVDPRSRFIACALYQGLLMVLPFDSRTGALKETVLMPIEEVTVLDICMSTASGRSLLCVLYEDSRQVRHVKTYEIQLRNARELSPGLWIQPNVDPTAHKLVPALEGVLLLSQTSITHLREGSGGADTLPRSLSLQGGSGATTSIGAGTGLAPALSEGGFTPQPTTLPILCGTIEALGPIETDNSRFLLGDEFGGFHVLGIAQTPNQANVKLTFELLGETSNASGICYLDNGVVFIASHSGDSQLVRLLPERDEASQSFVELLDTFANLGPITAMCVVDIDKQGRGQVVTCSGARKDGSLRVIRNGVGADEQCAVDLPGIKGMWSLQTSKGEAHDAFLTLSFPTETRVLGFDDTAMDTEGGGGGMHDEVEQSLSELSPGPAFDAGSATLFCGNVTGDIICQVTPSRVRFMPCAVLRSDEPPAPGSVQDWTPPDGARITVAVQAVESKEFGLAIALTGGLAQVLGWSAEQGSIQVRGQLKMEQEVACVALCQGLLAVGLWTDLSVRIYHVDSGKQLYRERSFGEEALPRSVVLTRFGSESGSMHLIVGLGDGRLVLFRLTDQGASGGLQASWRRTVTLGAQPIELTVFKDLNGSGSSQLHVFAACDRPAIIFLSANDKLLLSNVNVNFEVTRATAFDSAQFPGCLALASEERLVIGTVNDVQRLHIKTVPLHEQPRRIAHQPQSNTFAVCTMPESDDSEQDFPEAGCVRLLDDRSFDLLDSYRLDELEHSMSIISMSFNPAANADVQMTTSSSAGHNDGSSAGGRAYFVVGTAYADDEMEPTRGRILVLEVVRLDADERKFNLIAEKSTNGSVNDLCAYKGKVLAAINKNVQLYGWNDASLKPVSSSRATAPTPSGDKGGAVPSELLTQECGYHGLVLPLFIAVEGDSIIVGDLMKSMTLLRYDADKNKLEEVARDFSTARWATSVATLDEKAFLMSDIGNNISVMRPDAVQQTDDHGRLVSDADFHWGDYINVFAKGSLVMRSRQDDDEITPSLPGGAESAFSLPNSVRAQPKLLFATAGGAIGVLASLNEKEFALLNRLQVAMNEVVPGLGGGKCRFLDWRAFRYEMETRPSGGFVDGDLVETLLEMSSQEVDRVAELMNKGLSDKTGTVVTDEPPRVTGAELVSLVEELARLH